MTEAFPLQWPVGFPRSTHRKRSEFGTPFTKARDRVLSELRLMKATNVVISSNIPLRRDGIPYGGQAQPRDPGVAVYFYHKQKQLVLACDRWDRVEDNLHTIELTISAMRGMERWGVSEMLDRAFTGFMALPPPKESESESWWEVLKVHRDNSLEKAEDNYRKLAKLSHADKGGSHEAMVRLNKAIAEARAEKRKS